MDRFRGLASRWTGGNEFGPNASADTGFEPSSLRILRRPTPPRAASRSNRGPAPGAPSTPALDLGTNNLPPAHRPPPAAGPGTRADFRIVDSFLPHRAAWRGCLAGKGALRRQRSSAPSRALRICRDKMRARHVGRARLIATEACRAAAQQRRFSAARAGVDRADAGDRRSRDRSHAGDGRVRQPRRPGGQAASCCFDIGGGSSEIVWLDAARNKRRPGHRRRPARPRARPGIRCTSASSASRKKFGGQIVTPEIYEAMVAYVLDALAPFAAQVAKAPRGHPLPPARPPPAR